MSFTFFLFVLFSFHVATCSSIQDSTVVIKHCYQQKCSSSLIRYIRNVNHFKFIFTVSLHLRKLLFVLVVVLFTEGTKRQYLLCLFTLVALSSPAEETRGDQPSVSRHVELRHPAVGAGDQRSPVC